MAWLRNYEFFNFVIHMLIWHSINLWLSIFLFFSANTSDCAQQHEDEDKSDIFCSWVIEYSTVCVCICRSSQLRFPRKYFQMMVDWLNSIHGRNYFTNISYTLIKTEMGPWKIQENGCRRENTTPIAQKIQGFACRCLHKLLLLFCQSEHALRVHILGFFCPKVSLFDTSTACVHDLKIGVKFSGGSIAKRCWVLLIVCTCII